MVGLAVSDKVGIFEWTGSLTNSSAKLRINSPDYATGEDTNSTGLKTRHHRGSVQEEGVVR
jgi:hypothetical protein